MGNETRQFVSRGGLKLDAALSAFGLDVTGRLCADFGCNVGGFTDCLLQRGAEKVYAVDTGYGTLAWTLRTDPRVVVMERTNALHVEAPEPVDLVVIDAAWTCQEYIIPAAMAWLAPVDGTVADETPALPCTVSLLKPHYEMARIDPRRRHGKAPLTTDETDEVLRTVTARLGELGWTVAEAMASPLKGKGGNTEFLLRVTRDLQNGVTKNLQDGRRCIE